MSERAHTKGRGLDAVIDQASRLMAAGWRGNPNMSGDDRDFMTPSMRRRHDDKARDIVEFVLAATGWQPLSTVPEDEWLLVATTGGWVGEAMVLDGVWKWASGNVFHSDILPQKWMPLPGHPDNPASALSSQSLSLSEAIEALSECEEYFDNRADADCDQDGFIPNKEMRLLSVVRTALQALENGPAGLGGSSHG